MKNGWASYRSTNTSTRSPTRKRAHRTTIESVPHNRTTRVFLTSSHLDGIQILVVAAVSPGHRLCVLLVDVPRAEELVFVLSEHRLRISPDLR